MADIVLATLTKNALEEVRVVAGEWKGKPRLDVRVYAVKDDGEAVPTKKGVNLTPEQWGTVAEAIRAHLAEPEDEDEVLARLGPGDDELT